MQFSCPSCGHALEAPDGVFAKEGKCKFCGAEIISPASAGASATLKQSATPGSFAPPLSPPPPPPPPYQGAPDYQTYQPGPSRGSGMATASVILGVLGLFTCGLTTLFGLICGIIGLAQTGPDSERRGGRTMAIVGTVISAVLLLLIPIQAAILFPVFAKARERAQMTTCLTKVRGLEQAVQVYQVDHSGRLPSAASWQAALAGSIPNGGPKPFTCPVERNGVVPYKMNSGASDLVLVRIPSPNNFVLFFEGRAVPAESGSSLGQPFGGPMNVGANHSGDTLAMYGFADGSVRALAPGTVPIMAWQR